MEKITEKPKCEEIGFEHCWEDIPPPKIYLTASPTSPDLKRYCRNCGRIERYVLIQREIKEWQEIEDGILVPKWHIDL